MELIEIEQFVIKRSMMESNDINIEHLNLLKQKEMELRSLLNQVENTQSKMKTLLEQCQNLEGDKDKLLTYINSMENYFKKITDEKAFQLRIEQDLDLKIKSLEGDIQKLRETVSSGAVASFENENCIMTEECRRQVDQSKKDKEEIDKEIFQQEIKLSKAREGLEIIAKQFNSLAVEEGMGGQDPLALSVPVFRGGELVEEDDDTRHRSELVELLKALLSIQSQEGVDIQSKKKYLRNLEEKLTQTKLLQQEKYEEGLDFLQDSCIASKAYIEKCSKFRDEAAKSVLKQTHEAIASMRNTMADMNDKVDTVLADIEKNL